ncbi:unnamed protein product [Linum tenue]|uniref:CBF1-interacting co-repressor CIR N-terminal domain-containing protein n=1 Tax=Linum tenue TaxID=586396 RepID=A0AAV0M5K3_9ROSI|nr:unnamed protein product [Linum tenue]
MEGEEGGGLRLSKRINNGEVDYKTKSGTAWSHSFLNQKPWHPLSYPNQRRKWIAEQTTAQQQRRNEEVAREYAQEQEFFRQTSLISQKEKEKIEMMQAVSFMYIRPPGYNAESAKAAELADGDKKKVQDSTQMDPTVGELENLPSQGLPVEEKKKPRPKDVFGRTLPTEEQFEVLKNAPKLDTGVASRSKPFGIEIRNVKCVRCGNFGHQSGDRECPLKDAIMPNEESRLKRDDPLTAIIAQMDPTEPLKWELKQKPGMSPPRGGFNPDDPNQQIVAEDIFDEYGGFLSGGAIPDLLTNFSPGKLKKKSKSHKRKIKSSSSRERRVDEENALSFSSSDSEERRSKKEKRKKKKNKKREQKSKHSDPSSLDDLVVVDRHSEKSRHMNYPAEDSEYKKHHRSEKSGKKHSRSYEEDSDRDERSKRGRKSQPSSSSYKDHGSKSSSRHRQSHRFSGDDDSDPDRHSRGKHSGSRRHLQSSHRHSVDDLDSDRHRRSKRSSHRRDRYD